MTCHYPAAISRPLASHCALRACWRRQAASTIRAQAWHEVGHASFVLAYTRDNLAHVIYPIGLTLDDWVHDLPLLAAIGTH